MLEARAALPGGTELEVKVNAEKVSVSAPTTVVELPSKLFSVVGKATEAARPSRAPIPETRSPAAIARKSERLFIRIS
jgi:hypothetical protein